MKINSFTHVHDPERGSVELAPGEVPEWAVKLITNPSLVVAETEEESDEDVTTGGDDGKSDEESDGETVGIPKKGSSAKKWAEFALANGFEVASDATASQIREELDQAGVATE